MQSDFNCVGNKNVNVTLIWIFRGYFYKKKTRPDDLRNSITLRTDKA